MKIDTQLLETVIECKYLGAVLSENLTYAKDVERAETRFFTQFYSFYNVLYYINQKVLKHLLKLHAMSFYGVKTWFMKLHTKDLNNISIAYHKATKRIIVCKGSIYQFLSI